MYIYENQSQMELSLLLGRVERGAERGLVRNPEFKNLKS